MVIVWQLYSDAGFNQHQKKIATAMGCIVVMGVIYPKVVATTLLWINVVAAAGQPWEIWRQKRTTSVEFWLLLVYLGSATFWTGYGWVLNDWYIMSWGVAYMIAYGTGVAMYRVYQPKNA